MAEKYLACFPQQPCAICRKPSDITPTGVCQPCWVLRQKLEYYVPLLLADPLAAPQVRALLEHALNLKPAESEPPKVG
jgi:hypothetical protein